MSCLPRQALSHFRPQKCTGSAPAPCAFPLISIPHAVPAATFHCLGVPPSAPPRQSGTQSTRFHSPHAKRNRLAFQPTVPFAIPDAFFSIRRPVAARHACVSFPNARCPFPRMRPTFRLCIPPRAVCASMRLPSVSAGRPIRLPVEDLFSSAARGRSRFSLSSYRRPRQYL